MTPTEKQIEAAIEAFVELTGGFGYDDDRAAMEVVLSAALAVETGAVGWKLVPEEPTAFMISQGVSCDWRRGDDTIRNIWRSMVEASPTAEKCPTCDGTGKEGRHSICRDCDEAPASSAVEGEAVEKLRRMSWDEMDAAGMDYCPRCGSIEHVRRIGSPAVVIECETCTKAIADRSEPNGADRRPFTPTPAGEWRPPEPMSILSDADIMEAAQGWRGYDAPEDCNVVVYGACRAVLNAYFDRLASLAPQTEDPNA